MKQDSATWKFRTKKSNGNIYFNFENKFGALLEVLFIYKIYCFLGGYESNASNSVQIGVEMKKLWLFENNCTKLKGHFKIQLMNSKSTSK